MRVIALYCSHWTIREEEMKKFIAKKTQGDDAEFKKEKTLVLVKP